MRDTGDTLPDYGSNGHDYGRRLRNLEKIVIGETDDDGLKKALGKLQWESTAVILAVKEQSRTIGSLYTVIGLFALSTFGTLLLVFFKLHEIGELIARLQIPR